MSALETPTQLPCITNMIQISAGLFQGSRDTNLGHLLAESVIYSQLMSLHYLSFLHTIRTAGPLTIERISDLTRLLGARPFLDSFFIYNPTHQIIVATTKQIVELSSLRQD